MWEIIPVVPGRVPAPGARQMSMSRPGAFMVRRALTSPSPAVCALLSLPLPLVTLLVLQPRTRAASDPTEAQCRAQGLQFLPLVAEACGGGRGAQATQVWKSLAALGAARLGLTSAQAHDELLQQLGVTLQRENVRAVLITSVCL